MNLAKSDRGWMSGVAGDDVVTIGDPRLKAETQAVDHVDDAAELIARMVSRLRELNGAGLAAPQIGASVKVIVIEVRKTDVFPDRPTSPLLQMINPVIVEKSGTTEIGWEGCFSVPGLMGLVSRAEAVTVEYTSAEGADVTERYSGYVARVIQHEIDHLNGAEFVDRMTSMESLTTVTNYVDFISDHAAWRAPSGGATRDSPTCHRTVMAVLCAQPAGAVHPGS
ncbi:MAG: peptide deformylase [Pseudonocardiaceae bacterium]